MQNILSIDVSIEPALLQIVEVDQARLRVVESHQLTLGSTFLNLRERAKATLPTVQENGQNKAENGDGQNPLDGSITISSEELIAQSKTLLAQTIKDLKSPWTASLLLIPTYDFLDLNIDLPFGDQKNINKVLALEVQDILPFDLDEFVLEHRALGKLAATPGSEKFDVHVSIIAKNYLREVLAFCRSATFEPQVVSTPSSALGALFHLSPGLFLDNSAILCAQEPFYYLTSKVDGRIRNQRIIHRPSFFGRSTPSEDPHFVDPTERHAILNDLKLSLLAAETRYGHRIEKIMALGNTFVAEEIEQILQRPVEKTSFAQSVASGDASTQLASVGAVFVRDNEPPEILTNFRVKEFAYSPQLKELLQAGKVIGPYLLVFMLVGLVCLWGTFILRQSKIDRLEEAQNQQIRSALINMELQPGQEMNTLTNEIDSLQKHLDSLGSQAELSPLDALAELSSIINSSEVVFKRITIRGNKVELKGSGPDYKSIDAIEKTLKSHRNLFAREKKETSASTTPGKKYDFSFEIWLNG